MNSTESSGHDLPNTDTTGRRGRAKKEENVKPKKQVPSGENRRMMQQFSEKITRKKIKKQFTCLLNFWLFLRFEVVDKQNTKEETRSFKSAIMSYREKYSNRLSLF